jgi:membrane-associated protease RseP (regulator of RpoE activity)
MLSHIRLGLIAATAAASLMSSAALAQSVQPKAGSTGTTESSQRAYLGVHIQGGALVAGVDNNAPAQAAGIEPGDVIVRFDGKEIRRPDDLSQIVAETPIGKEVPITVIRGGQEGTITLKLGQRLVLSGTALDAYRQKLGGMLEELGSLGAPKASWGQPELQRFSELFQQFGELQKTSRRRTVLCKTCGASFNVNSGFTDHLPTAWYAKGRPSEISRQSRNERLSSS